MRTTRNLHSQVSAMAIAMVLFASCGFNVLYYIAPGKDAKEVQLEDARILLDQKDYAGAVKILDKLKESPSKDSNDVRLMLASAKLGVSGLDVWSIVGTLLENSSAKEGGVNTILSSISDDLIGEGEEKATKLAALDDAISGLKSAPVANDDRVANTACFLAGILVVPTISEATTALSSLQTAISAAQSGNCDGASGLSTALGDITAAALRFSTVLETAVACPFLNLDTSSIEGINGHLNTLTAGADKGCASFPPGLEAALPACVQTAAGIPNSSAAASDKRIDSCEIVLHCYDPTSCFK